MLCCFRFNHVLCKSSHRKFDIIIHQKNGIANGCSVMRSNYFICIILDSKNATPYNMQVRTFTYVDSADTSNPPRLYCGLSCTTVGLFWVPLSSKPEHVECYTPGRIYAREWKALNSSHVASNLDVQISNFLKLHGVLMSKEYIRITYMHIGYHVATYFGLFRLISPPSFSRKYLPSQLSSIVCFISMIC